MAGRNIKGIIIEIGGDSTDLQKALKEPEGNIRNLQSELSSINRSLQFQPGNIDLVKQKFDVVSSLVSETTEKLKILEQAQAEVQRQFESGEIGADQYRAFQKELETTRDKVKQLADEASLIDTEFKRAASAAGQSMQELGGKIEGVGKAIAPFSAAAAGVGVLATKTFVEFDDALRQVQATIGATEEEFKALGDVAKDAGLNTKFSANEAAEALNYLALAGYDTQKSIETLPKILNLASAGNLDLAYASDLVTDSLSALGLGTNELDRFIDELVRTSQRANTDVAQLGEAILTVGGQASLAGLSTNELNTALGILGDNGIKGSEAGTALRNTLKNLYTPTDAAAKALNELGIETSTSTGELRDIQDVLADLDAALGRLNESDRIEVMNKIFDSRTIAPANALLKESGERWSELSSEIDNAAGAADEAAKILESGIGGALRELKSAGEGAALSFGEALAPAIKMAASFLRDFAVSFAALPGPVKSVLAVIALLLAVLGPLLILVGSIIKNTGVLIYTLPKIITFISGISTKIKLLTLSTVAQTTVTKLATTAQWLWNAAMSANPIALMIVAIASLIAILAILYKNIDSFREGVNNIFANIKNGIQDFANSIKNLFTKTIPEYVSNFLDFFKQTPYEIGRALGESLGKAIQFSVNFKETLTQSVNEVMKRFSKFATELPNKLKSGFRSAIEAVITWSKDFIKRGRDTAKDFVNGVIDKIKSLPGEFLQLGKDAVQGFIDGIKAMFDRAINEVKSFFKGVLDGAKSVLEIHSPSKKFADIGVNSAAGWLMGWQDEVKNVKRRLNGAVSELMNFRSEDQVYDARRTSSVTPNSIAQPNQVINNTNHITVNGIRQLDEVVNWYNRQQRQAVTN